jgi:hypothetical protein
VPAAGREHDGGHDGGGDITTESGAMMAVRILPVVLAFLLLAAHFSRSGLPALSAVSLFFAGLVFVRRRWAARAIQILLLAGAAEWVRTTLFYVGVRKASGAPWLRLVFILGSVAVLTAAAALVFRNRAVRSRFGLEPLRES